MATVFLIVHFILLPGITQLAANFTTRFFQNYPGAHASVDEPSQDRNESIHA